MTQEILPVEQRHRDAAADFYGPHLSRPGEVLVTAHMRAGMIDESPLVQAFARFERDHMQPQAAPEVERLREGDRSVAQFFFEVGYGACFAEACIRNGAQVPWAMSDAEVERAWRIAGEAHDDPDEFYRYLTLAAPPAVAPDGLVEARKFQLGDKVEKVGGSSWHGRICGFYSTDLTPEGYAVESERELGSVQIYPAKALQSPTASVEGGER